MRDEFKESFKVNGAIPYDEVRLVGDNVEQRVYSRREALDLATKLELDLVVISDKVSPPVARILDFSKYLYEQRKRQKELKAKAAKQVMKDIRFGPNTDDHDFDFKLKHAINFLEEGSKVRVYVQFRGRAIVHTDRGKQLLIRFAEALDDYGKIDGETKLEGKRMFMQIAPKPGLTKKKEAPASKPAAPKSPAPKTAPAQAAAPAEKPLTPQAEQRDEQTPAKPAPAKAAKIKSTAPAEPSTDASITES